jgi:hypothetical protein
MTNNVGEKEPASPPKPSKKGKRGGVPRPHNSATSPRYIKAALRRREALQLRLQSHTYRDIAQHLGVSHTQIQADIEQALRETVQEPAQKVFAMEMHRLDELALAFYANAVEGDIPSAQMLLRIMEQRGRMLGFFDREHAAKFGLTITGAPAGGAPRELSLEFVMPSGARFSMDEPRTISASIPRIEPQPPPPRSGARTEIDLVRNSGTSVPIVSPGGRKSWMS